MPGRLKDGARCPECNTPLLAIADESRLLPTPRIKRDYYHQKTVATIRRRGPCHRTFEGRQAYLAARRERDRLEVHS